MATKISYKIMMEDVKALEKFYRSKGIGKIQHVLISILLPIAGGLAFTWGFVENVNWSSIIRNIPVFLLAVAVIAGILFLFKRLKVKEIRKTGLMENETTVEISERGLTQKDHTGERISYWTTIEEIARSNTHIFVKYKQDQSFLVIPGTAFADDEELEEFYNTIFNYWKANKVA